MKCRFLSISDEAYRDGTPAPVFLCTWASRLPVMPGWLDKMAGGGILIDHKKECLSCPCYSEQGHCEAPIPTQAEVDDLEDDGQPTEQEEWRDFDSDC